MEFKQETPDADLHTVGARSAVPGTSESRAMAESIVSGVSGLGRVPTELAGEKKERAAAQQSTGERRLADSGATIVAGEDRFTTGEEPPAQANPEEQLRRLLERSHVRQEAQLLAAADLPIKDDE